MNLPVRALVRTDLGESKLTLTDELVLKEQYRGRHRNEVYPIAAVLVLLDHR